MQKSLRIFAASALLASSSVALAVPFNSFDPRSMGMGGAGVAVGDASMAPFFNPALLTVTRPQDNFSLSLPVVGARVYDPSDFKTSLDDFQNGDYVNKLNNSIAAFNAPGGQTPTNLSAISNNTSTLNTQLATLSDKPIQGEGGAGMVIGIPGKSFGGAFFVDGWGAVGGVINYKDGTTLANITTALNCLNNLATAQTCLTNAGPSVSQYVNLSNPAAPQINFNTNQLQSSVDIRGVLMSEMGLAFSRQFGEADAAWAFGLTPKIVKVNLYDYTATVDSAKTSNVNGSDFTAKYTNFNFDVGLAKNYGDGWRGGFVVKNVIPHTYDFKRAPTPGAAPEPTGDTLKLKPQARIGASHTTSWSTVAMDIDLTANDPAGLEKKSQYLSLGGELNAWDWMQVRLGYRADLKDSKRNVPSVGLGIAPFGTLHLDLAVSKSSNEIGAAAKLALTF